MNISSTKVHFLKSKQQHQQKMCVMHVQYKFECDLKNRN